MVLSQLVEDDKLPANPALRLGRYLRRGDEPKAVVQPLTRSEATLLVTVARQHFPRWHAWILLTLRTGLRLSNETSSAAHIPSITGTALEERNVRHMFERMLSKAGLRHIRILTSGARSCRSFSRGLQIPTHRLLRRPKNGERCRNGRLLLTTLLLEELSKIRNQVGVTVVPQIMGGVRCYVVTPNVIQPKNRDRLLLNLHPGSFIMGAAGRYGTEWAVKIAGLTGYKVIVVDYRLLPHHPFPAAIDDAMAVWKHVITSTKPGNIAVIGGSVGGGMVLSLVQRARSAALPLPGAVISISPAAVDLSKTGDSYYTNAGVDGSASYDGFWEAVWKLYANGRDLETSLPALCSVCLALRLC